MKKMWMNDIEMAIDAYRVWLETKYGAENEIAFKEALEAFDTFFGEESLEERVAEVASRYDFDPEEIEQDIKDAIKATRGYVPGAGISVLETHERMREEDKL